MLPPADSSQPRRRHCPHKCRRYFWPSNDLLDGSLLANRGLNLTLGRRIAGGYSRCSHRCFCIVCLCVGWVLNSLPYARLPGPSLGSSSGYETSSAMHFCLITQERA
ncbi:hypothetical protein LIA77_01113 [Sarocladium implicatum]|nr:hypothetical protein LIA77_01113 [Sarocladium implicatum]